MYVIQVRAVRLAVVDRRWPRRALAARRRPPGDPAALRPALAPAARGALPGGAGAGLGDAHAASILEPPVRDFPASPAIEP